METQKTLLLFFYVFFIIFEINALDIFFLQIGINLIFMKDNKKITTKNKIIIILFLLKKVKKKGEFFILYGFWISL